MAKVVIPRKPVVVEREGRQERPSRVIALELHAPGGIGNNDFCYTPQLGNRLILYSIDVWVYCTTPGGGIGGFFHLMFGQGLPQSMNDVALRWAPIIPLHCGRKPSFFWADCVSFRRRFTMAKLFTTDELRFGVVVENGGQQAWESTVAFEISEG